MRKLLSNHVFSWLTFWLVIVMGVSTYIQLPRQQDPTINFNWIEVLTAAPGLSSSDVESKITDVLEDSLRSLGDVRFSQSTSTNGFSIILVRFDDISPTLFQSRVNDLRREIDGVKALLPEAANDPDIIEITSSNAFPSAMILVEAPAQNESLRYNTEAIADEIKQFSGVDKVDIIGVEKPELKVEFDTNKLSYYSLNPTVIADTIRSYYQDIAAGSINILEEDWNVRIVGTSPNPDDIANIPLLTPTGQIYLNEVAEISFTQASANQLASSNGKFSSLITVNKAANGNLLGIVDQIKDYISSKNKSLDQLGLKLVLLDDQTSITRNAINLMQNNAIVGLFLVLIVAWLFLGTRIAILTCLGIPFTLSGTFWVLGQLDQTLNQSVLLGVVIALGMIVDDAVVIVETIYQNLEKGMKKLDAAVEALREVAIPVTTAVLTTIAIFLPLMLIPGILGKFMLVIPLVVSIALLVSLLEAFWMLPAHISSGTDQKTKINQKRRKALKKIRYIYSKMLVTSLRYPALSLIFSAILVLGSFGIVGLSATGNGPIKFNFFASDTIRLFYINVEMASGTPIEQTLRKTQELEDLAKSKLKKHELRGITSLAGITYTEIEPKTGQQFGQVVVSLHDKQTDGRSVKEIIDIITPEFSNISGVEKLSTLMLSGGPPTQRPIKVKILSDQLPSLVAAKNELKTKLAKIQGVFNITDDDDGGSKEIILNIDKEKVRQLGFVPSDLQRIINLMADGEIVSQLRYKGDNMSVRVLAKDQAYSSPVQWMDFDITSNSGKKVQLKELFTYEITQAKDKIRHYNFQRNITLEADIDENENNTIAANSELKAEWEKIRNKYPDVKLDFSGELDDIQESLNALGVLFALGLLLVYLILGTQFTSYFQPLLIISTVPLAFSGVVLGLLVSGNPVSLYTMYGVVALMGIAVNSAIVLIAAANDRIALGMGAYHATVFAARRRVVPILITTFTTIAGLFSLAAGLAGKSLIWGPVANSIVWGLGFSTILALFVIPTLFLIFHRKVNKN
jgi:multidrug efflux pump subunit AcrB